jgi:hypothetical protein
MLQLRSTRLYKSLFEALATGVAIQEEGIALAFVKENGETKVQPSTGAAGERFAGVAIARNMPPASVPLVEEGIVAAGGSGALARSPIVGQLLVKVNGTALAVVNDPTHTPTAAEVVVVGGSYKTHADNVGKSVVFQYLYAPSVLEARQILGDAPYGGLAANALGTIGTIKQAEIGTSFFDASADWTDTTYAKLGAGGKFLPATASDGVRGIVVKNSPNAGNPFLVLDLNVG